MPRNANTVPRAKLNGPVVLTRAMCGWRCFPCAPRAKTPLLKGWPTLASSDLATIRQWAVKHPNCNWGVATGPGSGVFVLDVDGEKGRASLATLESQHGPLPATLTSHTGREDGGEHRWFAWPVDHSIRNSTKLLGDGLDIRAAGGYVIVPPSIHPTGCPYVWVDPNVPVADATPWPLNAISTPQQPVPTPTAEIGIVREGRRNDTLFRFGCYLRRKGWEQSAIESELLAQNGRRCRPLLPDAEVRTIAASAATYQVGGPDPLETAWQAIQKETCRSNYDRFLALALQLQRARPDQTIALPLERIGALMGVHYTAVGQYRRVAVANGFLEPAGEYVPHRRAGLYRFSEKAKNLAKPLTEHLTNPRGSRGLNKPALSDSGDQKSGPTRTIPASSAVADVSQTHPQSQTLTKTLTIGLVRVLQKPHSENPIVRVRSGFHSESGDSHSESAETSRNVAPRCYVHGERAVWWRRATGDLVCGCCHPNPEEVRPW
jgi:hypothetical protein